MDNQRGIHSVGLPFVTPRRFGGIPETPGTKCIEGMKHSKTPTFFECALRCAVSAIIVGTGDLDCPLSEINVRSRYPKNQPILLPNIKNAAIGGIMKKS